MTAADPLDEPGQSLISQLLSAHAKQELLSCLRDLARQHGRRAETLSLALAELHNSGQVDVLGAFVAVRNNHAPGGDFFVGLTAFSNALPHMASDIAAVVPCIAHLAREVDTDLAAPQLERAFSAYLQQDSGRPIAAIRVIEETPDITADLLTSVLIAGSLHDPSFYEAEAIRLCGSTHSALRRAAVFSLGKLHRTGAPSLAAYDALEGLSSSRDDHLHASIVTAAIELAIVADRQAPRMAQLLSDLLADKSQLALHAASRLFGFRTSELPLSVLEVLLTTLQQVTADSAGSIQQIDYGLAHLLTGPHREAAIEFLETFLNNHGTAVRMSSFGSTREAIVSEQRLLDYVATRWLLSSTFILCDSVVVFAGPRHGADAVLEVDRDVLSPPSSERVLFLARKAIGFLFHSPLTAACYVVSLMRVADSDGRRALQNVLTRSLLRNYTGKVCDYIRDRSKSERPEVAAALRASLRAIDSYVRKLAAIGPLPALYPSTAQREAFHRHNSQRFQEAMKAAEKSSTFLDLVSKQVILYGESSVSFVVAGPGEHRRIETPMQRHTFEFEAPRMDILNSTDLNFMLRVFKLEQLKR